MLGKIYTDMSGAYWFLRRPQDGIACLEKSIEFFDQTEHALNSVIAYNNLGINLMLIGEWTRAEEMIERALEIAVRENYVHVAGIYDSLGELKILRGEFAEAEELSRTRPWPLPAERKQQWYTVQSMRNLARCYLAQGKLKEAIAKGPRDHRTFAAEIGDKHYANMAGLVLAESLSAAGRCRRVRGRSAGNRGKRSDVGFFCARQHPAYTRPGGASTDGDQELAVHHFSRGLTIFEAAEDIYHTGAAAFSARVESRRRNAPRAKRASDIGRRDLSESSGSNLIDRRRTSELEQLRQSRPQSLYSKSRVRIRSFRSC